MPLRTLCDIFKEMRECLQTLNFSYFNALIEEAQHRANRMEAALYGKNDLEYCEKRIKELETEIETLEAKKKELERSSDSPK